MNKYYIVKGCGNINCSDNNYIHIIDSISYDAARRLSASLRNQSNEYCFHCGKVYGYYALQGEVRYNKKSITR